MRRFQYGLTAVSSLVFVMSAPAAFAGNCNAYGGQNCNPGVVYNGGSGQYFDPLTINVKQPLEELRSVHIHTGPTVSITRLYGQQPLASVGDNPSGFKGGCNPTTTQYCRQNVVTPVSVSLNQVPHQTPQLSPVSPVVQPTVRVGRGFNPAASQSRQYGEFTFTPGIAYLPTSYVDRNPATTARVLASGVTQSYHSHSYSTGSSLQIAAPQTHSVSTSGSTTPVDANGGYWEQVSGPTLFGNTLATQVVCRRQAPVQPVQPVQLRTQVLRPVIAVPTPVPAYCQPTKSTNRYGIVTPQPSFSHGAPQGRWVY